MIIRHTNTLMTFELDVEIPMTVISRLVHGSFIPDLHRKSFPSVTCTLHETGATLNIFRTGKIVVGGLNSDFLTLLSAELCRYVVNCARPPNAPIVQMKCDETKTNDVWTFDLKQKLDVIRYCGDNKENTKITGKFNNVSTKIGQEGEKDSFTLIIFATGVVNVIGVYRGYVDIYEVAKNTESMLTPYIIQKP